MFGRNSIEEITLYVMHKIVQSVDFLRLELVLGSQTTLLHLLESSGLPRNYANWLADTAQDLFKSRLTFLKRGSQACERGRL